MAVPPMLVHPTLDSKGEATVQIAVSNEKGTVPLVIRKGDALARLHQTDYSI